MAARKVSAKGRAGAKSEGRIRPATIEDLGDIQALVEAAYALYLPRMPKPPGPMLDDYSARIRAGQAFVYEQAKGRKPGEALGLLVLIEEEGDALLLDNLAVSAAAQGQGIGSKLAAYAESEARRRGYKAIKLYTHETMTENVPLYEHLGYKVTGRGEQAGYSRIFMRKELT